ncbi:MAG: NAD-dependent epimerase/dehydratase family protein, partial [Sediminibacterium sp.]
MYKILLTGATGFIGTALHRQLKTLGHTVHLLSQRDGKVEDMFTWQSIPPTDIVIHLAARTFVPDSWEHPAAFMATNATGTLHALEYCRKHKAKFIFLSSYLYGNPEHLPIPETAPLYTPNPYAQSKKTAEDFCTFYSTAYQVNTIILRPFNVYGPNQNPSFLIPHIIHQALYNSTIRVKDLTPKRDYIHLHDLIAAIIACIDYKKSGIFNVGSGISYSVQEIIDIVQNITKRNLPVISDAEVRRAEIMDTVADISLAKKELDWQ